MRNIQKIIDGLSSGVPDGGATIDQEGHAVTKGLVVALAPELEQRLDYKHLHYVIPAVEQWLEHVKHRVTEGVAFGLWVDDDGVVTLDLVEVFHPHDLALALGVAKERDQKAIQYIDQLQDTNQTLWLKCPEQ